MIIIKPPPKPKPVPHNPIEPVKLDHGLPIDGKVMLCIVQLCILALIISLFLE